MGRRANLTPLTQEQSALVAANVNLVFHVVRGLRGHGGVRRLGEDEALGVGFLALVESARFYDRRKGRFSTLACSAIHRSIRRVCNRYLRPGNLPVDWNFVLPRKTTRTTVSWDRLCRMYGDLYERGWLTVAHTRGNA